MADYREISQEYAKEGIKAAVILNSGAMIAVLTQLTKVPDMSRTVVGVAMALWSLGIVAGAFTWVLAFASTRYVDKSEREPVFAQKHIQTSDNHMKAGYCSVIASLVFFLGGCLAVAIHLMRS
ncbi:hypothetical protein [Camelimonas lactis]|uniref:Uncharacterized protein n=1 Tax=Camelimonas lactis TaxID=659006 RepID=A0A4R2GGY2_9HYPH|nr:hypothetical protein [Camelimonas lactis]TCO07544.1 hypothetical protein EV666_1311 [Camelimonas lactis]